ncbi:MAG: HEAT repeat domain-containing protein [Deltaproteobacteria bacterium]|nr:HEAT repeat domain-containing protein [Candidatus Zymogenaceae bacterium]
MVVDNTTPHNPHVEALLVELMKAQRSGFMYPPGHPTRKNILVNTYHVFRSFLDEENEFRLTVGKKNLKYNDIPIGGDAEIQEKLFQELTLKNISELTFKHDLTISEMEIFVDLLNMNSRDFRNEGGAQTLFVNNNLKSIAVKEADYDTLLKNKEEGNDDTLEEGEQAPEPVPEEEVQEEEEKLPDIQEEEKEELHKEIDLYLTALSQERDLKKYRKILLNLVKLSEKLAEETRTGELLTILIGITREVLPKKKRPRELQVLSIKAIKRSVTTDVISSAIDTYCNKGDVNKAEYSALIKIIGEDAIEPTIEKLIVSDSASERRNLIQIIVGFGEHSRGPVESYLSDDRWYVVRNMVSILGHIGNERSLGPLMRIINHDDVRIQREVIHALTKIGGKQVIVFLLKLLEDAEPQQAIIIINALGVLGDTMATAPLVDIAKKRDILYRNYELRKEAINNLGRLKSTEAIDALGKILLKAEFLGGLRNEDLRISAAKALGRIGGEEAVAYLISAVQKRDRIIRRAAESCLASLGYNHEHITG